MNRDLFRCEVDAWLVLISLYLKAVLTGPIYLIECQLNLEVLNLLKSLFHTHFLNFTFV